MAYGWLFNWSDPVNNPNENVRIYAVRAIVEQHSYAIGQRVREASGQTTDRSPLTDQYVNDKALVCTEADHKAPDCEGLLYAAKAPGMAFVGVLPHLALRSTYRLLTKTEPPRGVVVWWLRLTCVILPTLLAWLWLAQHLTRRVRDPRLALAVVLCAALGSLSLTYGQMFAGHQPAGLALLLCYGAVLAAGRRAPRPDPGLAPTADRGRRFVAGAAFAGAWATLIEFPAGPPAFLLLGWLLWRRRNVRDLGWLTLGAALPVALLAHHNTVAFGAPWRMAYGFLENPDFVRDMAPGVFGISLPTSEKLFGSLLSPFTGLYFWAPWTLLAWLGVLAYRRREQTPAMQSGLARADREDALVAWLICLYFLYFQCSQALWRGGWVLGPRYVTALVPFAAIAAAHGLAALRGSAGGLGRLALAVAGPIAIAFTGLASAVSQGFPFAFYNPLVEAVAPLLAHGYVARNPAMALGIPGPWSALPYFVALAAGALWVVWLAVPAAQPLPSRLASAALALLLAFAGGGALWHAGPGRTPATDAEVRFLMASWTPPKPPGSRPLPPPAPPPENR